MADTRSKMFIGGLYIPIATGLTNLYDMFDDTDTGQDLIDQATGAEATLFIPIHPNNAKWIKIEQVIIGYVDASANINDLADVALYEGTSASQEIMQRKTIWNSGAIAETPVGAVASITNSIARIMRLDTAGRIYFTTNWTTAVLSCGVATEYFFIKVYGEVLAPSPA